MIQSIFILNNLGDIIIEKHYRGLINRAVCDYFWEEVTKAPNPNEVLPVIQTPKYYLIHIQRNSLFFLSVVSVETSPLLVIEFLHRVGDVFTDYFEKLNEINIRENFVTVYQLLDELLDNGFPFTTEPNALMEIIPTSNVLRKFVGGFTGSSSMSGYLPDGSLSNTPWRKMGVKYATNEIYFDIIEEIHTTVEQNGMPSYTEVSGEIQSLSKLSGMPDLLLTFQNPHILDDVSFHPCVRYNRFEQNKVLSFVPPDGNYKLMSYRVKGQLQLPLYVKPQISLNSASGSGRVNIMVGSKLPANAKNVIEELVVIIPFPKNLTTTNFTTNVGSIQIDDITKTCRWIIGKLPKEKTPMLEGSVSLSAVSPSSSSTSSSSGSNIPAIASSDASPIVQVEFKITQYSASGLKVDSLALHNENYKPYKGVRSITKAGKFHVRS